MRFEECGDSPTQRSLAGDGEIPSPDLISQLTKKMTNEEILKKAIEKAKKNGWCKDRPYHADNLIEFIDEKDETWGTLMDLESVESIIFSHDFAKAFWGEEFVPAGYMNGKRQGVDDVNRVRKIFLPAWQYHLQQMVLEEDPIKYLEQFI